MKLKDIFNLFKTEEEIRAAMPLNEVVSVLKQKLIEAHLSNETIIFTITALKKTGFQVKVKGIFAFVPFSLMPFKFSPPLWDVIKNELIGQKFFGKIIIAEIINNRFIVDASVTEFEAFNLIDGATYKAIILKKASKHIIVEIGHRYNWQFGSQCYLVTFDSPNNLEIDYYSQTVSDEIDLTYVERANNWTKITFEKKPLEQNYITDLYSLSKLEKIIETKQNQLDILIEKEKKLEVKIEDLKQAIPENTKVIESKYQNLLHLFEKQQKTIEQLKKRNIKLQQNHQKSLNQVLQLVDEKLLLEEKYQNLEAHLQLVTSQSKFKNYDKVIEMLEILKEKSNQQKNQITNLEALLKNEREKNKVQ